MAKGEIITGLDVGSSMVRSIVAQKAFDSQGSEKLEILGMAQTPAEGVRKGVVVNIEEAVSSISDCLEKAERMSGVQIENAFVSISGSHIITQPSKGVIAVSRANGEITEDDVERVIEAAQAVATPPNYEILHVIPRNFLVDNQSGIKDPVGMNGVRLEVEAQIIQGMSSQTKNLTKAVYRTGVDINDLVFSGLAASESALTTQQKDLGSAMINIGRSTTTLVIYEEGDVLHSSVIPIGGGHITSDIAIGLRTSIEAAEKIKLQYGTALPAKVEKGEHINLADFNQGETTTVPRKHVAEIIEARLEEIFDLVDKELKKINRSGLLPAGVVLTGGTAKMPGVIEVAKRIFRLPSSIGYPRGLTSIIEKVNDPVFVVSVGLILWGNHISAFGKNPFGRFSSVEDITKKMKTWFKSLIP